MMQIISRKFFFFFFDYANEGQARGRSQHAQVTNTGRQSFFFFFFFFFFVLLLLTHTQKRGTNKQIIQPIERRRSMSLSRGKK